MSIKPFAFAVVVWMIGAYAWAQEPARVISSTPVTLLPGGLASSGMPPEVSYRVVYELAGKQYQVDLPYEPGPTLWVSAQPEVPPAAAPGSVPPPVVFAPASSALPAIVVSPAPVAVPSPVYISPYPYAYPYPYPYPHSYGPLPFSLHFGVGYYRGYGHRWR